MAYSLSRAEARDAQLVAQGLAGPVSAGEVSGLLSLVGAVQLDTISVLARSHELVAYARFGAVGRTAVEETLWGGDAFEYWAHAACVVPMKDWPLFEARRRAERARLEESTVPDVTFKEVRARLAEGPATANDLGGAKAGGPWWDWTDTKRAVEQMLARGEVVCVRRKGFQRVYELTENRIPSAFLDMELSDDECRRRLVEVSGAHLGVATEADLADYYRLSRTQVASVVSDTALLPVTVDGWASPAWAHPRHLEALGAGALRHRTTLLSPFDSLIWDRARTERIFDFSHRLEAYVPRHKRVDGYYAMPVLAGGRLVGKVDPGRDKSQFVAKKVVVGSRSALGQVAVAIRRAARWVGAETVRVDEVAPIESRARLVELLRLQPDAT